MSLKNAIHRYWENTQSLTMAVPIENVITGKVPDEAIARPFVVIADAYESVRDSSTVIVQEHTLTFTATTDDSESAESIIAVIERMYDGDLFKPAFLSDENESLIDSYWLSSSVDEPEPGIWVGTVTYRCYVETTAITEEQVGMDAGGFGAASIEVAGFAGVSP